ncbi:sodium:solute symporter family protein [Deferribacter autotrophicus]|uniref:Sodium:solute symporter family protein n=1 Tax=Deferribacter autotrophicus TaxID=500465 RepID=A0A5A8F7A1_9BACT|nr:sodium:solute symporter family protein [Deferribacter autotrophicus]KAA0257977.1 sodium:solute symporter family protein [Deferribacter autotrophicus]
MLLYKILFIFTLIVISFYSVKYSKKVKSKNDFSLGGRSFSSIDVSALIIGTLVGGASTVGTVQMAFIYGIPACLFTLGSGIACLLLGLFFSKPLRESEVVTVSEYIGRYFGDGVRRYTSFLSSFGMFIHIVAQFLAAGAIISAVFGFSFQISLFVTFILLIIMIVSGGIISSAVIGRFKIVILYSMMILSFLIVLLKSNFLKSVFDGLPSGRHWFWFQDYGYKRGVMDLLSMIIGVISTQTYLQAIFSARSVKEARQGAFISAALIPPIGFIGVAIGLYLRVYHPEVSDLSAKALPYFIEIYFPKFMAAVLNASLLIIVLGTAAGLTLGVSTNMFNDLVKKVDSLIGMRMATFFVIVCAFVIVIFGAGSKILDWSFLSMGFRGFTIFLPLVYILFVRKKMVGRWERVVKFMVYILPIIYVIFKIL